MRRDEIISELGNWNFPVDQYVLISTGALVMHGLKEEAGDVDISCTKEICDELSQHKHCIKYCAGDDNHPCYQVGHLEASTWFFHPDKMTMIGGIPCQSLEDILELKTFLNRDKDQQDIALIKKALSGSQEG